MSNTEQQRSAICRAITSFGHSISADKVTLHRDNGEKDNLLTLIIDAVEKELAALSSQSAVQELDMVAWRGLWDSQWVNIVNHDHGWENHSKEDAVHEAVKMTEERLRLNNTHPSSAAQVEEIRNAALEEAISMINAGRWAELVTCDFHRGWNEALSRGADMVRCLKTAAPSQGEGS